MKGSESTKAASLGGKMARLKIARESDNMV